MNGLLVGLVVSIGAGAGGPGTSAVPVLVELFSSEGCSSCPPADALLMRLLRDQPVPGVRIIALAEHVDYWNDLGWRDPFSLPLFTARQETYARRLAAGGVYTPQLVVAGAAHLLGSDEGAARAAIAAAATTMRGEVSARVVPGAAGELDVAARWPEGVEAEVLVALVQDRVTSGVKGGENAGRKLEHVAVARSLSVVGSGAGSFSGRVMLAEVANADRAVVFVQERNGGPIHGAATAEVRW
jgi:hypothetical protein